MTGPSTYGEGERVFGPPLGTFDVDWVAGAAHAADPSLGQPEAQRLAAEAWRLIRSGTPDLAGALGNAVVAAVALEYCDLYGVP